MQLTLFPTSERAKPASPDRARLPVPPPGQSDRVTMWTAPYACMRGGWYFRFYWQQPLPSGEIKTRHIHIRGGSTLNPVAIANRAVIDQAIADGLSLDEIKLLCRSFVRHTGNYKRSCNPA